MVVDRGSFVVYAGRMFSKFCTLFLTAACLCVALLLSVAGFAPPADAQTAVDVSCNADSDGYNANIVGCRKEVRIVDVLPCDPADCAYDGQVATLSGTFAAKCVVVPSVSGDHIRCVLGEFLFPPVTPTAVPDSGPADSDPCDAGEELVLLDDGTLRCLVPSVPDPPQIAFTGAESTVLGYLGAGLIGFGAVAVAVSRRREDR